LIAFYLSFFWYHHFPSPFSAGEREPVGERLRLFRPGGERVRDFGERLRESKNEK
jgi:hypothetical protein